MLNIYTDGACSGNPGPGGWGVVLIWGTTTKELSGFEPDTTNNRMELQAAIEGLKSVTRPVPITLFSDSSYLVNAVTKGWLENWVSNGWRTSDKKEVKNRDLWEQILGLNTTLSPTYVWVKGHANNKWNNRADELATGAIKKNI